ncbi:MAG: trehalose-6-phosphate synthase [Pseudomonadota bacterium]
MFIIRFILPLFFALTALAVVATPLAENFVSSWFRKDVEQRSQLIFQSVEDVLMDFWKEKKNAVTYQKLFDKIALDKRVLSVGLCSPDGKLIGKSSQWPSNLPCPEQPLPEKPAFLMQQLGIGNILISSFYVSVDDEKLTFVVLHDLTFSVKRTEETRFYLIGFLIIISVTAAFVTIITARLTLKNWLGRLRLSLIAGGDKFQNQGLPREFIPVVREVKQMLRDMKPTNYQLENIKVDWTPQTLRHLLEQELPGSEVIVVSNREPYIHNRLNDKIVMQRPASGVVTALEPILRACGGTWIAHGSGSADRDTVDSQDCIAVPPEHPEYSLRRIWLTQEEEDGYYYGFANEGMWPLCHITFVRPNFRESDWQAYKDVNRKFADAVIKQAKTKNPVVLVQDYHFALLPRYIRESLPDATIITFWHIPWPNPEVFSICPWREEILSGLLGSSVLGFHTQFHCQNFMDTVDRFLESHINRDQSIISAGDHTALIRPYPISIAWPPEGLDEMPAADICRENVHKRFDLGSDIMIGVGVERFDYTKGIIDRFQSIRELLRIYPQWRGKFCFIQAAAPTRSRLQVYQDIQQETEKLVEEINNEFGGQNYKPIILMARHHEPVEVFELFRAADFCIVSSLHDGMNLVAKEFVASRDDDKGTLILSTFAGASKELLEALLVNPYDTKGMAEAMHRALIMPLNEQKERMHLMREMVKDHNVYHWAARILLDAAHLRKRARIESLITKAPSGKGGK